MLATGITKFAANLTSPLPGTVEGEIENFDIVGQQRRVATQQALPGPIQYCLLFGRGHGFGGGGNAERAGFGHRLALFARPLFHPRLGAFATTAAAVVFDGLQQLVNLLHLGGRLVHRVEAPPPMCEL